MNSSSEAFVSNFTPIGGKRETNGNEHGNERETNSGFLCKIGNGPETRNGNEKAFFLCVRFHCFSAMRQCRRAMIKPRISTAARP